MNGSSPRPAPFRAKPLSALTRLEIARLADLPPDVVSRHFKNKHALMTELGASVSEAALDA